MKQLGGIIFQVVERLNGDDDTIGELELGDGQKIEEEMAQALALEIFRLEQAAP